MPASSAAVLLAQPPVILNGPVTMAEGETVVQPAQGIEGPGNTSHWCAYNVPGQAAVVYGYLRIIQTTPKSDKNAPLSLSPASGTARPYGTDSHRRPREVDTSRHFVCIAIVIIRWLFRWVIWCANGHPSGSPWRQFHCTSCNGYFLETHGTLFHGK